METIIIDCHVHCGIQNVNLSFATVKKYLDMGGIQGACLYPPVEDVYDRYDYHFEDNATWIACRQRANRYVLDIQAQNPHFFAYYFVWNDFNTNELKNGYKAVKWHRHDYEPEYNYDDPRCESFLQEVYHLKLPIVLEESFKNTLYFIERVNKRTPIIIPHMGGLNGGFSSLFKAGVWDNETVYADTALASGYEMKTFLDRYGSERLLFGSDFPFGNPGNELQEVLRLNLGKEDLENVVSRNVMRLLRV